jgi:hypothetical protein
MEEKFEIQPSLQIIEKVFLQMKGKKKWNTIWKIYYFKKENEDMIVKMHCVGHFIV